MSTWDETRIAELRTVATALRDRTGVSEEELDAYCRFANLASPAGVLSLLDELESVRRERDELVRAVEKHAEAMAIECMLGVGEWDSCVPSHLRESFFAAYRSTHPEWR